MAKIIENSKGFLVMEISRSEMLSKLGMYGYIGLCDNCCATPSVGYYVAVLDCWFCPDCYANWSRRSVRYPSDIPIEEKNFNLYKEIFRL